MWQWGNVPIPPQYLIALALGAVVQRFVNLPVLAEGWIGIALGLPLAVAGGGLAAWAVRAAGETSVDRPGKLIRSGPYRFTRNPMYLGWSLLQLGVGLAANWLWLLILLPLAFAYTHYFDVLNEERRLKCQFGEEYRHYQGEVPRYL